MDFKKRHILLSLFIISTVIVFSACNKYWAPFDEGIVTVAAERILHEEIPYRDFMMLNYPPGQIYLLAFLYKIFGVSLEAGRIYTLLVQVALAILGFLICSMLTDNLKISIFSWSVILSCLGPRLGTFPAPIWPGMMFAIFSIYLFMKYNQARNSRYIIYAGLAAGLSVIFRHDIGLFVLISISIGLLFTDRRAKNILLFIFTSLMLPLSFLVYFILKGAWSDLYESLIAFPFIHHKAVSIDFPKPCFNLNMIFHQSLYFIKINQFYIPLLIYGFIVILLSGRFFKKRRPGKNDLNIVVILIFGILTFNQVRVRTDPAHLLTVIYPAIFLFCFILGQALSSKDMPPMAQYTYRTYAFFLLFLISLLFIKNIDKYFKNVYRKPYKKQVLLTRFDRGSVYIPREESEDIKNVVSFIKRYTDNNERIYIGNIAHWKDDFGGTLLMYTLSERLPQTKYYEILPGLITQRKVQEEIKNSFSEKAVNIIVLQDIDTSTAPNHALDGGMVTSAGSVSTLSIPRPLGRGSRRVDLPLSLEVIDKNKLLLDDYIKRHFKFIKKFGKYNIYERSGIYR